MSLRQWETRNSQVSEMRGYKKFASRTTVALVQAELDTCVGSRSLIEEGQCSGTSQKAAQITKTL